MSRRTPAQQAFDAMQARRSLAPNSSDRVPASRPTLAQKASDEIKEFMAFAESANIPDKNGQTPLFLASHGGNIRDIRMILAAGVDVNDKNEDGETALFWASLGGQTEAIRLILAADADVNHVSLNGETALFWASRNGQREAIIALVNAGADVNHANNNGETSLFWASNNGTIPAITALLDRGADVNHVAQNSETVMSLSLDRGQSEVVTALLRSPISLMRLLVATVQDQTFLGERNPYNISLDTYSDDGKMGMFFRYGPGTVVSIYFDSHGRHVAHLEASAPICTGDGRVIYSKRDNAGNYRVYENGIDLKGPEYPLCHRLSSSYEKNWGCFGREEGQLGNYFIVYSVIPLRIFRVEGFTECKEVPEVKLEHAKYRDMPEDARVKKQYPNFQSIEDMYVEERDGRGTSIFRGGTRGIKFGDEYLFVGHVTLTREKLRDSCFQNWYMDRNSTKRSNYPRMYFMYFFTVGLTNGIFKLSRMSSCFQPPSSGTFHKIIFPCGIAHRHFGNTRSIIVSFGRDDSDCMLTSYTEAEVNTMLAPASSWNEKNYCFHPNYAASLRDARSLILPSPERSVWRSILPKDRVGLMGTSPESDGCFNPAITTLGAQGDKFVTAWRKLNGSLQTWVGYNQIAIESCSLKIREGKLVYSRESDIIEFQAGTTTVGGEDPRLITDNDCPILFINDLDASKNRRMYVHNLTTDYSAMTIHPFCHNMSGRMEKNWGPFYVDGKLHFVYNVDPFVVARVHRGFECPSSTSTNIECQKLAQVPTARNLREVFHRHGLKMRGGTPGLLFAENEYLFVGHAVQQSGDDNCFPDFAVQRSVWKGDEKEYVKMYRQFYTAFFYTVENNDGTWRIKRLSCCSHFPGKRENFTKIHFPAGLAKADLGGEYRDAFIVSFGEQDVYGGFCAVNRKFIECVLRPVDEWNVHNYVVDLNYFQSVGNIDPEVVVPNLNVVFG